MLLTELTNFLGEWELVKNLLYLGTEVVVAMKYLDLKDRL